ncbi:MAG: hypothetical protein R3E79_11110 [Caldilineaceae bacterium]
MQTGTDLAGSLPVFPKIPGDSLATGLVLSDLRRKQLIFNRLAQPGQVHVYSAECRAGERLRVQMFVPVLPLGGSVVPAFAVVAQSLPYSADVQKLPLELPAGYSAVVAPPPGELLTPVNDMLTRVRYYPGPLIDTRTLVGGRCYIIVWSPHNHMGKYVLQVGANWPWKWALLGPTPALLVADPGLVWLEPRRRLLDGRCARAGRYHAAPFLAHKAGCFGRIGIGCVCRR